MPRLATVKMRRKRDGRILIVNQADYLVNAWRYGPAYDIISERRGDATPEEEKLARSEAKAERYKIFTPEENKKRKIDETRFEDRKVRLTDETSAQIAIGDSADAEAEQIEVPSPAAETVLSEEAEEASMSMVEVPAIDPEWRALQWFKRREYIGKITGTKPTSAKHAEELMAPFEGSR